MQSDYLKMWLRTLINEEINSGKQTPSSLEDNIEVKSVIDELILEALNQEQLISTAKHLHLRPNILVGWLKSIDPTPTQSFGVWLLRGLKNQWIQMEDKDRVKNDITRFIKLRNANKIEDIMKFPHINDLENKMDQLTGHGSKRQGFAGVDPSTLDGVEIVQENTEKNVIMYKVTNTVSLNKMGEGTKWCTRESYPSGFNMAAHYLNRFHYIFVVYKDGKPFLQFNPDYSQVMDANDVSWRGSTDELGGLKLPPPNFPQPKYWDPKSEEQLAYEKWAALTGQKIDIPPPKPVTGKYSLTIKGEEPKDVQLMKRWHKLTGKPIDLPTKDPKFDKRHRERLAKSIRNSNSYGSILNPMIGFLKYAEENKTRVPEVEKAILDKNWKDIEFRYFGGGGKMRHLPGMLEIIKYVKHVIKGNWPEFEKKIQNDVFNSVYYYMHTGLNPHYITNQNTKDFVMFIRYIQDKHPDVRTSQFEERLKDFLLRAKKEFKHGLMQQVIDYILKPYMKQTGKSLKDILGNQYYSRFYTGGRKSR